MRTKKTADKNLIDAEIGSQEFSKKEKTMVDNTTLLQTFIPPLYYWEDVVDDIPIMMTMAYRYRGENYGLSFPIEDKNVVKINILRKKLFHIVRESLDVMFHHGVQILDSSGNINPNRINDLEAIRFTYDKNWKERVATFNGLCKIVPITKMKARELKLLV